MKAETSGEPDLPGPDGQRALINELDGQFARLHHSSRELVSSASSAVLEGEHRPQQVRPLDSVREYVLRSAAVIEQTFGGITANLWDDPFEWTLPETLNTRERIIEYLEEVEATRRRAFASMANDNDLSRDMVLPSGETRQLIDVLRETISRAAGYQDRAHGMRDLPLAQGSREREAGEAN